MTSIRPDQCNWFEEVDGNWSTSCGQCFEFTADGPKEANFNYCCWCGGKLVAVLYNEEGAA